MADDKAKKTKIDLKARLGRTTAMGMTAPGALPAPPPSGPGSGPMPPPSEPGAHGSTAPPASRPSTAPNMASVRPPPGISQGIAPPPGLSPGIPLPPFAQQPRQAAPRAEKPSAAQQTIKVEIGEEIHDERKKARRNAGLAAVAGVFIGLGIGFDRRRLLGDQDDRAKSAARGAGALEKDVKEANDKLVDLDTKLTEAADKLNKSKVFPDDLSTALAGLTIPFDSTNLDNKGVNGLPNKVFKMVLNYTQACENLNKLREQLKNAAFSAKDPMTKAFKEEKEPVANYSVTFRSDSGAIVADLVQNKDNFAWKASTFPSKLQDRRQARRQGRHPLGQGRSRRRQRHHRHPHRPQDHLGPRQRHQRGALLQAPHRHAHRPPGQQGQPHHGDARPAQGRRGSRQRAEEGGRGLPVKAMGVPSSAPKPPG